MTAEVSHGKRNLLLLAAGALLVTVATTCVSLWVYRTSGDIYLDRSRPGYLPDQDEIDEDSSTTSNFVFSDTGALTKTDLDEYLKELKIINDRIQALSDPYAPDPLTDESLGITKISEDTDKSTSDSTKDS